MKTVLQVLFYALVAAASPLALTSTLVVLRSRPTAERVHLRAAFLLGGGVVWLILLSLGAVTSLNEGDRHGAAIFELALGLLLLAAAWQVRRGFASRRGPGAGRTRALLTRLEQLTPTAALPVGALLGHRRPEALDDSHRRGDHGFRRRTEYGRGNRSRRALRARGGSAGLVPYAIYLVAGQRAAGWLGRPGVAKSGGGVCRAGDQCTAGDTCQGTCNGRGLQLECACPASGMYLCQTVMCQTGTDGGTDGGFPTCPAGTSRRATTAIRQRRPVPHDLLGHDDDESHVPLRADGWRNTAASGPARR